MISLHMVNVRKKEINSISITVYIQIFYTENFYSYGNLCKKNLKGSCRSVEHIIPGTSTSNQSLYCCRNNFKKNSQRRFPVSKTSN